MVNRQNLKFSLPVRVSGCTCFVLLLFVKKMEKYSLEEEDDYGGLFLTQSASQSVNMDKNDEEERMENDDESWEFLGLDSRDFQSPCCSLVNKSTGSAQVYSDISDNDFDMIEVSKELDIK